MSERIIIDGPSLDEFETELQDSHSLPTGAAMYLWNCRDYNPFTLTDAETSTVFKIVALASGDFLVITASQDRGWYVESDTADQSWFFPSVELCSLNNETDREEEYIFDETFPAEETCIAARYKPSPIRRCHDPVTISHLTVINGSGVPVEWQGLTTTDSPVYIRSRSGTIEARIGGEYGIDGDTIFHVFIGKEFPGTHLKKQEVLQLIDAVDYINIDDNPEMVPEQQLAEMFEKYRAANPNVFDDLDLSSEDIEEIFITDT